MAQRISEQVIEYLTIGGNSFTPQTNVPLTINGKIAINDKDVSLSNNTWPTTWLLNPSSNDFIIAKNNNNDGGTFNYARPTFKIDSDAINIGKKLLLQAGPGGGFNLSDGTVSSPQTVGLFYIETLGTSNTNGITTIQIGNSRSTGTTSNAAGKIKIYSSSSGYGSIVQESTTSNYTHTLPSSSGWIVKAATGGAGTENKPIYISSSGIATAGNDYGGGTCITLNNTSKAATTASFYAPTTGGTSGYILKANGNTSTPSWLQTLPTANGGTGNTSFTQYRLIYTSTATKLATAANLYTNGSKLAINKTSIGSDYTFEVNGASFLNGDVDIGGNIVSTSNNAKNLGAENNTWKDIYVNNVKGSTLILDGLTAVNAFSNTDHPLSNSKFTGNSNVLQIDNGDVYINNNCEINNRLVATNLEVRSQSNAMYVPMVSYSTYNFNSAPENRLPLTILLPQNISPSNSYFITFMIDVLQVSGLVCYYIMMDWFEGDFSLYETQAYRLGKAHSNNNNRPDLRTILFFRLIESNTNIQRLGICLGYSQSDVIFNQLKFIRVRDVHIYKKGTNTEINCDDYATDWVIYSSQPQEVLSHTGNIYNNYLLGNANSTAGFPSLV